MLDQKIPARPRVALVFGDAASVAHLRDAVSSHVEIVYDTAATDFDPSRLAGSRATAALVNVDGCEWLDTIEVRLQETGVAVVFNDPEISSKLDGWAQARWLRHLTAKLSGNRDFDPPRPTTTQAHPASTVSEIEHAPEAAGALAAEPVLQVVERPLSPAEIEAMTADFGSVPEPSEPANSDEGEASMDSAHATDVVMAAPDGGIEHSDVDALDVDTEALSAMIDARLAAAAGEPAPESPEVWRVVGDDDVSVVEQPPVEPKPLAVESAVGIASTVKPAVDDSDVLKALPALDDWQLVDPEAPIAPAGPERALPSFSIDLAGLELVPVETVVPVSANSESLERWMHAGPRDQAAGGKSDSKGERA